MIGWLPLLPWALGTYDLVDVSTTHPDPGVTRIEYRISTGASGLNRFSITQVRQRQGCLADKEPVILLSPFLLPGSFYEIAETGQYADSLAGRLAADGYDVWLVDQRRSGLAPGACEQRIADCSVMVNWDFNALADDGLLALAMVKVFHPGRKPVVGGFSAGANTTLALVNRMPHAFAGAFLYEGTFYSQDPVVVQHNASICTSLNGAIAAGQYYDPSAQIYGAVLGLAQSDPNGLSPIPVFPPGTTNKLAMFYVFSTPPPSGALSPTPGFVRCLADFSTQQFVYTNPQRLFAVGPKFDNYAALAPMRDLACGLAGVDRSHVDHLAAFHGDLMVFVEGTGFGQSMFDTAGLFTHAQSITIDHHPEFGEADPYFHSEWQDVFYEPLRDWLDQVAFR